MIRKLFWALIVSLFGFALISCQSAINLCGNGSTTNPDILKPVVDLSSRINDGLHLQKVDNLFFLVDDSESMLGCQGSSSKRIVAYELLSKMNRSTSDLVLAKGVRIFGPYADREGFKSELLYGMANQPHNEVEPVVVTITPKNPMLNQIAMALDAVYQEHKSIEGNSAVIILSDLEVDRRQLLESVALLKGYYNDRVRLYPVQLGSGAKGNELAAELSNFSNCGRIVSANGLQNPERLADYLESILFDIIPQVQPAELPIQKVEEITREPVTSKKVEKPQMSYENLKVKKEIRIELRTRFDFGKSLILPEYVVHLQAIADFMNKYQDTRTVIEGHTCNIGSDKLNMRLSKQRAETVKNYLVDKLGIDSSRIGTRAYGESRPIADNSTPAGRSRNRRAVAVISTVVEE